MAVFERSILGQKNRNLFLGSDLIVYVEGGDEAQGNTESFDILFWYSVFKVCRPNIKVRFLPKGGKDAVIAIAREFLATDIVGVCVAVDVDYDELRLNKISDPRVLYTYGYSFENDVLTEETLLRAFYTLCPKCPMEVDLQADISVQLSRFAVDIRRLVLADFLAVGSGFSIIDRKRPQKYLVSAAYGVNPRISQSMIALELAQKNVKPRAPVSAPPGLLIRPLRDSVGCLYAEFCYRIVTYFHSIYSLKSKITKDGFISVAIQAFVQLFSLDPTPSVCTHYKERIAAVPI